MSQARRLSDHAAYLLNGDLVENGITEQIFRAPADPRTADYVAGRYG